MIPLFALHNFTLNSILRCDYGARENNFKQMYKLENLIGHIRSSKKQSKNKSIENSFFFLLLALLCDIDWTETFCAALFIAIYWTLCAYCEIISVKKTYKRWRKFMFDVGPLCELLHITSMNIVLWFQILSWHFTTTKRKACRKKIKKIFFWVRDVW